MSGILLGTLVTTLPGVWCYQVGARYSFIGTEISRLNGIFDTNCHEFHEDQPTIEVSRLNGIFDTNCHEFHEDQPTKWMMNMLNSTMHFFSIAIRLNNHLIMVACISVISKSNCMIRLRGAMQFINMKHRLNGGFATQCHRFDFQRYVYWMLSMLHILPVLGRFDSHDCQFLAGDESCSGRWWRRWSTEV